MSGVSALAAGAGIAYEIVQISQGELYEKPLGGVDRTPLIQLGILALWGLLALREKSDLAAASYTLVGGLSFIFAFEAIYKWSFYLTPFKMEMPASEVRQLGIQLGTAMTVLTGFASRMLRANRWTAAWAVLFIALWVLWLAAGFPQITEKVVWPTALPVELTYGETYLINRLTKGALWLAYLSLFPASRGTEEGERKRGDSV